MFACAFEGENEVLGHPHGMTADDCDPLSVLCTTDQNGLPVVISCWKCTPEELAEINRTGRVWLGIMGVTMPPAWLSGTKPFTLESDGPAN